MNTFKNHLLSVFSWACVLILLSAFLSIIGFLLLNGYKTFQTSLIFGDTGIVDALLLKKPVFDGLFPAIAGTVMLVIISVAIALPLGLASGIYLAEYSKGKSKQIFSFLFDVLSGVPSIVTGLFGFSVAVFLHHYFLDKIFPCLLISALSLAFLVLPYIIRTTQTALEEIPMTVRNTALCLGATRLQNILFVLVPSSFSGILSGIILAIGRCAEDTAVIMLTGVVAMAGVPNSLFSSYEALPFYIYYMSSQYASQEELGKAYGAAVILVFICMVLFTLSLIIKKRIEKHVLFSR